MGIRLRTRNTNGDRGNADRQSIAQVPGYPLEIREALNLSPCQRLEVLRYENRLELIPVKPPPGMRGILKGMETTIVREPDREL